MKRIAFILVLLVLASLLSGSIGLAADGITLPWSVIAGGGGHAEADGVSLDATIGQPLAGMAYNDNYEICSGFWCQVLSLVRLYLPLIGKGV
jgi:hypothetical protein